jgi:hypothetical protein
MHRLLAWMLIPALAAASGARLLHTHAYGDHDHPEHHHGLAAHDHDHNHDRALVHDDDDHAALLERCDPGEHAVSLSFVASAPAPLHTIDAVIDAVFAPSPPRDPRIVVRPSDVRAHGPPGRDHSALRAPPPLALA